MLADRFHNSAELQAVIVTSQNWIPPPANNFPGLTLFRWNDGFRLLGPVSLVSVRCQYPFKIWDSRQSRRKQLGQLGYPRRVLGSCFKRFQDAFGTFLATADA